MVSFYIETDIQELMKMASSMLIRGRYEANGQTTKINPEVGCSNGIGWTNDGKTMCTFLFFHYLIGQFGTLLSWTSPCSLSRPTRNADAIQTT